MSPCKLRLLLKGLARLAANCQQCRDVDTGLPRGDDPPMLGSEPGMTAREFRARRAASGLTMQECAGRLEVSLKSVWRWENGKSPINVHTAAVIRDRIRPGAKLERMDRQSSLDAEI